MIQSENRTIEELLVRYELEPSLRDVYVEGASDATIIDWVLREAGCRNSAVYEINTVDVPTTLLIERGLDDGNKGRVLALCFALENRLQSPYQVTGIADRDCDSYLGKTYESPLLLWTDYSCVEMYFFELSTFEKLLHFILGKNGKLARSFLDNLTPILHELFYIRVANQRLSLALSWIEPDKQCEIQAGLLKFEADLFIDKYLNKNSRAAEKSRFLEERDAARQAADEDPRHSIHGHDFLQLLGKLIYLHTKNRALLDRDTLHRVIAGFADHSALAKEPMFRKLIHRVMAD